MTPQFFSDPARWRAWLEQNHATATELLVGFHKTGSGIASITWPESVDEALCFGWIDGVRKSVDAVSYTIRFTPRKPVSTWSAVNLKRAAELVAEGRLRPAGLQAFAARKPSRLAIYAYEQKEIALDARQQARFEANAVAWSFFQSRPPGYRKTATWWVVSAKREETRDKRLLTLIDDSEHGRTLAQLTR